MIPVNDSTAPGCPRHLVELRDPVATDVLEPGTPLAIARSLSASNLGSSDSASARRACRSARRVAWRRRRPPSDLALATERCLEEPGGSTARHADAAVMPRLVRSELGLLSRIAIRSPGWAATAGDPWPGRLFPTDDDRSRCPTDHVAQGVLARRQRAALTPRAGRSRPSPRSVAYWCLGISRARQSPMIVADGTGSCSRCHLRSAAAPGTTDSTMSIHARCPPWPARLNNARPRAAVAAAINVAATSAAY